MKLKIISIEPDYDSFPAIAIAVKAHTIYHPKDIVTYQILEVPGVAVPIERKLYTDFSEATLVLQQVKEDALLKLDQFNYLHLPGKEFDLVPVKDLKGKEFEVGDDR